MRSSRGFTQIIGLCALLMGTVDAQVAGSQTINTGPPAPPGDWFGQNYPGRYSRGQSFTVVGPFTDLTSFGFYFANAGGFPTQQYRAYLAQFTDPGTGLGHTVGPLLWQSSVFNGVAATTPTLVTFTTPGIFLTAGQTYIAMLSAAGFYPTDGSSPLGALSEAAGGDTYAGGQAYLMTDPLDDPSVVTTGTWRHLTVDGYLPGYDYAFQATLLPAVVTTPEPSTLAMTLPALGFMAIIRRWRRRRSDKRALSVKLVDTAT